MQSRNKLFDFYKGIAIILVVMGHTFQYIIYPSSFDESIEFRLIYSFHMPLFVLVSGMVASLWILQFEVFGGLKNNLSLAIKRLEKSAIRLMLPFISWAIFKYFYYSMSMGVVNYLYLAFQVPDEALWFLPCIFLCILFWVLAQVLILLLLAIPALRHLFEKHIAAKSSQIAYQLIFVLLAWLLLKNRIPYAAGGLLKSYFIYFFLGVFTHSYLMARITHWKRIVPYVTFILLAPFWYRVTTNNLPISIANLINEPVGKLYSLIIALAGSFAMLDICKILYEANWQIVNKLVEYCGKISLGIYAIHFYVLHISLPIIAPLLISIIASTLILQIPLLRTFLLGEPLYPNSLSSCSEMSK